MDYTWNFAPLFDNYIVLLRGLGTTALLWAIAFPLCMLLGLLIGLARLSRNPLIAWTARGYVEVFRNIPILVQLVWFFYAMPILLGVQLSPFTAALFGLVLNSSAYAAEIFRGGMLSIPRGQWEGAKALGMTRARALRRVVLPQVMRRMLPAFTNRGIELAKNTSVASVITVHELMYQGRWLSTVYFNPLETFTILALVYFLLIYPGTYLASRLEKRYLQRQ
ncbi:amino acid ABC transporter permease [Verticiella sediminum]|uniref:Glutamate/aspartate import permease protein GltK n=1 Tax=Verticiella sediminum TaxID=1247510 RepID=A0A556AMQ4_9BURK|nr:amino acid ABC transporter permease [Verticiella sediminum]TSH94176.1 amino acid ABC transporter permease [Verticiella sediminum]